LGRHNLPRSPLTQCCPKPFVLSSSKHERLDYPPFDRLRVNGFLLFVKGEKEKFNLPFLYNYGPINNLPTLRVTVNRESHASANRLAVSEERAKMAIGRSMPRLFRSRSASSSPDTSRTSGTPFESKAARFFNAHCSFCILQWVLCLKHGPFPS
jgi:hypothetical protein